MLFYLDKKNLLFSNISETRDLLLKITNIKKTLTRIARCPSTNTGEKTPTIMILLKF